MFNKAKGIVSSTPMPKGAPIDSKTNTNKGAPLDNNDPKTTVKFTPFTSALDRSRLIRTGAQSVIKSATEVL